MFLDKYFYFAKKLDLSEVGIFPGENRDEVLIIAEVNKELCWLLFLKRVYDFPIFEGRKPKKEDFEEFIKEPMSRVKELLNYLHAPIACFIEVTFNKNIEFDEIDFQVKCLDDMASTYGVRIIPDLIFLIEISGIRKWFEPPKRKEVILPPFKKSWGAFVTELREKLFFEGLEGSAQERAERARHLSQNCLEILKLSPFYLRIKEENISNDIIKILRLIVSTIHHKPGRRYLIWSLIYLCSALAFFPNFTDESRKTISDVFELLIKNWELWTTKEKRVIVRGVCILSEKVGKTKVFLKEKIYQAFFIDFFELLMRKGFSNRDLTDSYFYAYRLFRNILRYGIVPDSLIYKLLHDISVMRKIVLHGVEGMLDRFIDEPSSLRPYLLLHLMLQSCVYPIHQSEQLEILAKQFSDSIPIEKLNESHIEKILEENILYLLLHSFEYRAKQALDTNSHLRYFYHISPESLGKFEKLIMKYIESPNIGAHQKEILKKILNIVSNLKANNVFNKKKEF